MLFSRCNAPVTAEEPGGGGRGGHVWMVPKGETGMKATETGAGRHIQKEMFDSGAALAA